MRQEDDPAVLLEKANRCRRLAAALTDRLAAAALREVAEAHEAKSRELRDRTMRSKVRRLPCIVRDWAAGPLT